MDIQPFLIGRPAGGQGEKQVHIDMNSPRIAHVDGKGEGMRVFDDHGRPTPYLETLAEKLGELDAGFQASADFLRRLAPARPA